MNQDEIRETVVRLLAEIAPEIDPESVQHSVDLRDQFDLDSMDWLNFIIAIAEELRVEIPESDYHLLVSVDAFVDYLTARLLVEA
jgi:acyl carrier protein